MSNTFWGIVAVLVITSLLILGSINKEQRNTDIRAEYGDNAEYVIEQGDEDCTDDCSGHQAGYDWAEENDVCDLDYDSGNSDSFAEGVRQWAEDNC